MNTQGPNTEKSLKRRLLLPTLLLGMFLIFTGIVLISTLLINVASSFNVSVGTASQLGLVTQLVGLILGFAMGAITLRFKHKSLFLFGTAIYGIGELGFYFAPNFATALLVHLLVGIGGAMTSIMIFTLIGENLPLEKRGLAIGLVVSTAMSAWVFVAPLSGFVASIAEWRLMLIWFIFPLSMFCLILGFLVIPSSQRQEQPPSRALYARVYKQILLNKSATACLVGTMLVWIFNTVPTYAVSFYRIFFSVSPTVGGAFAAAAAVGGMIGGVSGGKLVNRYGRKPLTVVAGLTAAIAAILFTFVPITWVSVGLWVVSASSVAVAGAAFSGLVLEQVPEFRASMMSVNSVFQSTGIIAGLFIGGLILNLYARNYQLLMTIFGAAGIASSLVVLLLAKDPCKNQLPASTQPTTI